MYTYKTAKKSIILTLIVIFFANILVAQRTRTRTNPSSDSRTQVPINEKFAFGANMGNFGFGGGGFSISAKGLAGYKFAKPVVAGVTTKVFYDIISNIGQDISLLSYGAGLFGRLTIAEQFFLQGEYNLTSYDTVDNARSTYNYPMVGGGYESGFGSWKYGIMLLFNLNDEVRDLNTVDFGEYWITFSYNF